MKKTIKRILYSLLLIAVIIGIYLWLNVPLIGDEISKQTIYVSFIDAWYGSSQDAKAHAMWIDDDSSLGVFKVKKIADEIGIQPNFAVIADRMEDKVADSLAAWQRQGAGIVLHGLRHERWNDWSESQIRIDIRQSIVRLHERGFDTTKIVKLIIPPHGCNTRTIRKVISEEGYQMISGASLINPDRQVFQLGRIAITPQTDTVAMRNTLQKAYNRNAFVIFSTHSSISSWFSEEKTRQIISIAKEIGFDFKFCD